MSYVKQNNPRGGLNSIVFSSVTPDIWVKILSEASTETLSKFREVLHWLFPPNIIHQEKPHDLGVIEVIVGKITPDEEDDLIKRFLLQCLKKDIERSCSHYEQRVTTI